MLVAFVIRFAITGRFACFLSAGSAITFVHIALLLQMGVAFEEALE